MRTRHHAAGPTRRALVSAAASGLVVGLLPPGAGASPPGAPIPFGAWIRVGLDGAVTLISSQAEMGQGIRTTLAAVLADELGAAWPSVRLEDAPIDPRYRQPLWQWQITGGATSVRSLWMPLRKAAATAREMLIAEAAGRLRVAPAALVAADGQVVDRRSGRMIGFGALAARAARRPVPENPPLRPASEWRLIGHRVPRLEGPGKVDGSAVFGIDHRSDGLLHAAVAHAPGLGGRLIQVDAAPALQVAGVVAVVPLEDGVTVVAASPAAARAGLEALRPAFTEPDASLDDETLLARYRATLDEAPGAPPLVRLPEVGRAAAGAARNAGWSGEQEYVSPLQAHATMEPQNCTAEARADRCLIVISTQNQETVQLAVAEALGLAPRQVEVRRTLLGGGFGRRLYADVAVEAARVSRAVGGRPVQLLWSREEDMRRDAYRPLTVIRVAAGADREGRLRSVRVRVATSTWLAPVYPRAIARHLTPPLRAAMSLPFDPIGLEGLDHLPYDLGVAPETATLSLPVPTGVWRSTGYGPTVFALESFIDEQAAAAAMDPVAYRRSLMGGRPDMRAVLDAAAEAAGWGRAPPGRAQGVAVADCFGSRLAQVVEVSTDGAGLRIHRVVTAVDPGVVLDPDVVRAQVEGGVVWSLTAAAKTRVSIQGGAVVQSNFHDFPPLTMAETPEMDVVLVPSGAAPGGIGEAGVVPVAPALCNAIFAATGRRIRSLPLAEAGFELLPASRDGGAPAGHPQ